MSDDRLRSIERATDPADEVARVRLLLERVRAGVLSPDRLRLAAEAGSVDARRALGWPEGGELGFLIRVPSAKWRGVWQVAASPPTRDRLHPWVQRLAGIERRAGLRAAIAASWATIRCSGRKAWAGWADAGELREARAHLHAVCEWVLADELLAPAPWAFDRIPRGHLGRVFTFWTMLARTARCWNDPSGSQLPTGARTVSLCLDFLERRTDAEDAARKSELVEGAIAKEVSRWALRSETPGSLPSGEAPEVRTR